LVDVASETQIEISGGAKTERAESRFGRLDSLMNDTAPPFTIRFEQITPDEVE
jgi:hypothetical protein